MKSFIMTTLLLAASCSTVFGLEGRAHRRSMQLSKRDPEGIKIHRNCQKEGDFMLTFHDGPSEVTDKLLDKLIALKVPATFFINGNFQDQCIYKYADVIQKAYRSGYITLGHHTWSHTNLTKEILGTGFGKLTQELDTLDKAFGDILGFRPKLFSPPTGFVDDTDSEKYFQYIKERKYEIVHYKIDTKEKAENSSKFARDQFKAFVENTENLSGISISRDLRLENVEEVIGQAVGILRSGGADGTKRKYNIVNAETCLGFKPFYQHDWEGRKEGDVPKLKEAWKKPELTCQDHVNAAPNW